LLIGVSLIGELSERTHDLLVSFGERLSTTIISEILKNRGVEAGYLDARKVIKTDDNFGFAAVNFDLTNKLIQEYFSENTGFQCVTGFMGSTEKGVTTTLGRGGSDYTASILGAALDAEVIEIWTDVNGMMTADPRKVSNAFTIPEISYAEAMELSHFGAKVIYPPSLTPAFSKEIPIKVLNTFDTDHPGTRIQKNAQKQDFSITGISSIDDLALINVQGNGMIGVAGVSARLFTLLAENNISVILISQASSEHSICFAVNPKIANSVKEILEKGLSVEIANKDIDSVLIQENLSVIAIVGEGMKNSSGISGKLFSVLGRNGVNVIATAQGSSELNISVVIQKKDLSKSLNAIHDSFFDIDGFTLNVFIVGATGLIGKTLLRQINDQREFLKERKNLNVNIVGLTNTRKSMIEVAGLDLENWEAACNERGEPA
ncbi:MAG: aspartate kinase, partial [Spirosomataceae bacterium]